ncbi:MAG TPA: hypothetical protein PLK76_00430 [bacterium]|nr:hypothetical protein [bacterium]
MANKKIYSTLKIYFQQTYALKTKNDQSMIAFDRLTIIKALFCWKVRQEYSLKYEVVMEKMMIAMLVLAVATMVMAQKVTDIKVSSGQSALSSGLGGAVTVLDSAKSILLMAEFNSTLGQFIFLKNLPSGISVGPSFGVYYKTVWAGPFVGYTPNFAKFVTFTSWFGVMAGEVLKPTWKANFCFAYHSVDVVAGNFGAGFSVLHYLDEKPAHMPTINYSLPCGNEKIILSATYNLDKKTPLFMAALKHTF